MPKFPLHVYADAAELSLIAQYRDDDCIAGVTTNPTIVRRAGVTDYLGWAREAAAISPKPISLEVLSLEEVEVERQADILAALGPNVFVKVPVMDEEGWSRLGVIERLVKRGVQVNVTALIDQAQAMHAAVVVRGTTPAILSIFAGRIADAGRVASRVVAAVAAARGRNTRLLWASTREVGNIMDAYLAGADIITVPDALLAKARESWGSGAHDQSLAVIRQFGRDAREAGFVI
jgi:transaldolase